MAVHLGLGPGDSRKARNAQPLTPLWALRRLAPVTDSTAPKKTPLFEVHVRSGAKITEFGGWSMPVQYTSIMDEHHAVRNAVGLFDISHMGQVFVEGPQAATWLNAMLANNVDRISNGGCQYTFLLNEKGGVIDDLIVYHYADGRYLLVINAAKIEEDVAWLQDHLREGVQLCNRSAEYGGLAIQGPKSVKLFDLLFDGKQSLPTRNEIRGIECDGIHFLLASTGYTGEDGFEIFFPAADSEKVWDMILQKGAELGIKPCGLGARDTLRLEMCYPLNGSDLTPEHTPLEAGLSIFVDLKKRDFIGKTALVCQKEAGIQRRLVPFKMKEKSPPPRSHYGIFKNGQQIGEVSSGSLSPSLNLGIGMAYLPAELARIGEEIEIDVRGRRFPAVIEKKPLHRK